MADAASQLHTTNGRIGLHFVCRVWYLVLLIIALFGGGIYALLNTTASGTIVAGASSILASIGLTWKSADRTLGTLGARIDHNLWGPNSTPRSPTQSRCCPTTPRDHAGRRHLKMISTAPRATDRLHIPERLEPVMDPQQVLTKIDQLRGQQGVHRDDLAKLPGERRLPVDYFDRLRAEVTAEQADPHRVFERSLRQRTLRCQLPLPSCTCPDGQPSASS